MTDNGAHVTRSNLLQSSDVHNIKAKLNLIKGKKNQNDSVSVAMWVEEQRKHGSILCYQPISELNNFHLGKRLTSCLKFGCF